ncbi:uncharacterized protein EDB93DRAFT_700062 [Suillus bovinus]|uniref:uncharacterized protein n=1 Tax=Suillus bovinus TaxID=48563 RepID=UPI001B864848|nr:uncharacterized protein EDB93DRAFT_700062 [Suillus bovinus]KAG2139624.1 hypothetical protein EDB93DRAFT_700062 [Suillus bovinus]
MSLLSVLIDLAELLLLSDAINLVEPAGASLQLVDGLLCYLHHNTRVELIPADILIGARSIFHTIFLVWYSLIAIRIYHLQVVVGRTCYQPVLPNYYCPADGRIRQNVELWQIYLKLRTSMMILQSRIHIA